MPEELGNLLIRVTSVGFDEVIESINELEEAVGSVSSNSAFSELQYALDGIKNDLDEISEGLKQATHDYTGFGTGAAEAGEQVEESTKKLQKQQGVLGELAKAYASFWVMFNAPRQLFNTLDGVAKFNRELTSMSVTSQMSRGSLLALGTAAAQFGGSAQGIASLAGRYRSSMQNLRIGKGGGAWQEAATLYGLDITGSGAGGLATSEEALRNIVELLPTLSEENQLGLKDLLGIDDGTFQMMKKGLAAWDEAAAKQEEDNRLLKESEKGTEEWFKATAELDTKWKIMMNEIFKQLGPIVKEIVGYVKDATEFLKEHPKTLSTIYGLVIAISTGIAAWKFAKAIKSAAQLLGIFKKTKAIADGIVNAAGSVGGGAAGGSAAGGIGNAASTALKGAALAAGIGTAAVSGVGDAGIGVVLYNISKDVLEPWFAMWQVVALRGYVGNDQVEKAVRVAVSGMGLTEGQTKSLVERYQRANSMTARMAKNENIVQSAVLDYVKSNKGGRSDAAVSIAGITINVNSSAANAEEVAKAVREEFFAQVNASIEDAVYGSRML